MPNFGCLTTTRLVTKPLDGSCLPIGSCTRGILLARRGDMPCIFLVLGPILRLLPLPLVILGAGGLSLNRTPWLSVVSLDPNRPSLLLPPYIPLVTLHNRGILPLRILPPVPHRLTTDGTSLHVPRKPCVVVIGLVTVNT